MQIDDKLMNKMSNGEWFPFQNLYPLLAPVVPLFEQVSERLVYCFFKLIESCSSSK